MFNYEACGEGIKEGLIEAAKLVPGLGILIEGVRARFVSHSLGAV